MAINNAVVRDKKRPESLRSAIISMTMNTDFSKLVSRELLVRSLAVATGSGDVHLVEEPRVERAVGGMEGFLSLILRVSVSYRVSADDGETHSMVFIVKRYPQIEPQREITKSIGAFDREGFYFDKVVPVMKRVSGGKVDVPLPNCFVAAYGGENEAIVMEDLSEKGFRTPDPKYLVKGLDVSHCSLVMKMLGRLHALAVAAERALPAAEGGWLKMIPELSKDSTFYETEPDEPPVPWIPMINSGLETLAIISKELDGLPMEVEASGLLGEAIRRTWPTLCRLVKRDPKGRNLLTHGDCWMNNIMFRYQEDGCEEDEPVDVKFIDLQLNRYCHPCVDILYFMYLGTTRSFRKQYFDRLIVEYFESMVEALNVLDAGSPPFSLEEFKEDLHSTYEPFGVIIGTVYAPIQRLGNDFIPETVEEMTPEKIKELFETGNSSVIRKRFVSDPEYRSLLEECAREFVEMAFPNGTNSVKTSPLWRT